MTWSHVTKVVKIKTRLGLMDRLQWRRASQIFEAMDREAVKFGQDLAPDGPPLGCGQFAGVLNKSSREVVFLSWAERLDCGLSGQGERTVRRSLNKLTRDV